MGSGKQGGVRDAGRWGGWKVSWCVRKGEKGNEDISNNIIQSRSSKVR